jgi:NAD(P)H-hydrate epimerase
VVQAHRTFTFGVGKVGLESYPGAGFAGRVEVIDIGFPAPLLAGLTHCRVEREEVAAALGRLPETAHKGTRGRVLVLAGSVDKPGAAALVARGALRAGAGLVTVGCVPAVANVVLANTPEAMVLTVPADAGQLSVEGARQLSRRFKEFDALVLGPGLGTGPGPVALVESALNTRRTPLVLDADALNVLAENPAFQESLSETCVMTPHPGELGRLLGSKPGEINAARVRVARDSASRFSAVVVLKGARTVTADPEGGLSINPVAEAGLATAGSGDVLSGVIGALAARGLQPVAAAWCGVWLHGQAGQACARKRGPVGYLATEIADSIPGVPTGVEGAITP